LLETGVFLRLPLLPPGPRSRFKISILIPCYNEEKSIRQCVDSCLAQTRRPDEIIVVDDCSIDSSPEILASYGQQIKVVKTPKNSGNKSRAQEYGLGYVSGDIFIATDGDTFLEKDFVERIEKDFSLDPNLAAVGGYVKSQKYNWLTACREIDYIFGQDLYKSAQSNISYLFVIPGCAGAFRTQIFKKFITFDHDTLTEDLDFTYKLHMNYLKIKYDKQAVCWTKDPFTIRAYANQMRRWYGGGWQNLLKNFRIVSRPANALELSLMYIEGLIFSFCLFLFPLLNINFFKNFLAWYLVFAVLLGYYCAARRKRIDLFFYSPLYLVLVFINAWVFLEQFFKEVIMRKRNLFWFKAERFRNSDQPLPENIGSEILPQDN
jgi:cellulose synthase/poly-beta-1,6-N-acetylglucosamine synthase-like glycosyltransferase